MIEIKNVSALNIATLPEALSEYSLLQWERAGEEAVSHIQSSERVWALYEGEEPLALAGVHRTTLMGQPCLWMLTCKGMRAKHVRQLRFVREALYELYHGGLIVWIESGAVTQEKFAEHFGFRLVEFGEHYNKYGMN